MLALAATLAVAKWTVSAGRLFGWAFRGTVWEPSQAVVAGRSPYPRPDGHALLVEATPAVYPPAIFFAAVPLGLLSATLAAAFRDVLMAGCLALSFRLVGVRDWRVYALVFVSYCC